MAAVITDFGSDFGSDSSRSHYHRSRKMRAGSGHERSPAASPYRQTSQSRVERRPSSPRPVPIAAGTPPPSTPSRAVEQEASDNVVEAETETIKTEPPPSPPLSSSSNPGSFTRNRFTSQENFPVSSTSTRQSPYPEDAAASNKPPITLAKPEVEFAGPSSLDDVKGYAGNTIKVRDLAHIQSFASEDFLLGGKSGRRRATDDPALKYEISGMPITDIIEMVAGLLTKITTTNDQQHETLNRPIPSGEISSNLSGLSSSVLAFHGKNVPSITILSYLSRIHKYCPTTYEVFLSLLVYFDRMTEPLRRESMDLDNSRPSTGYSADGSDLADSSSSGSGDGEDQRPYTHTEISPVKPSFPLSHFFVVDSFNIHRLVIAGVTCASKFFSDVFYTNSRYAKVGGLPLPELNHLELQFLLLNDFRLSVPVEELEAYGTMLVEFYAREVIAQRDTVPSYAP
ncbi:PHO85 cyclin [Lachnellula subtilissima]|uniref:PHO85 cyclin n=1 Tax=Lachnellula subtilissima TaxID=602034 RepID=A0A8H8RRZ2_9HELO|nr:PHO85 cyclin [Lachnellula subtilissima]